MAIVDPHDVLVRRQMALVERYQNTALKMAGAGQSIDPEALREVRQGLVSAIDKLATLEGLRDDADDGALWRLHQQPGNATS